MKRATNRKTRVHAVNRILRKLNRRMRYRYISATAEEWEGYERDYDYWVAKKKEIKNG